MIYAAGATGLFWAFIQTMSLSQTQPAPPPAKLTMIHETLTPPLSCSNTVPLNPSNTQQDFLDSQAALKIDETIELTKKKFRLFSWRMMSITSIFATIFGVTLYCLVDIVGVNSDPLLQYYPYLTCAFGLGIFIAIFSIFFIGKVSFMANRLTAYTQLLSRKDSDHSAHFKAGLKGGQIIAFFLISLHLIVITSLVLGYRCVYKPDIYLVGDGIQPVRNNAVMME
jgi:Na+/H+-translocating membrane pyrophosphatase